MRNGWLEVYGTKACQAEGYIHGTRKEGEACVRGDAEPSRLYRINDDWTLDLVYENKAARDGRTEGRVPPVTGGGHGKEAHGPGRST